MNNHTPGPWTYEAGPIGEPDVEDPAFLIVEPSDEAEVVGAIYAPIRNNATEANARLIAAAPELLAALEDALHLMDTQNNRQAAKIISAAIQKATKP